MIRLHFIQHDVSSIGSAAVLFRRSASRTGIYWLTFDDGEEYVGQSVEVATRFATHRRHQRGEITSLAFAPVPRGDLDVAERAFIAERDVAGASLRNKLLTRYPGGRAPVEITTTTGETIPLPWDRSARGLIPHGWAGTLETTPTQGQARQWAGLQEEPAWPRLRTFLRSFVRETMSVPHLTGGYLWTASALPNTVRRVDWYRLCTVNVGRIEAVYVGNERSGLTVVNWNLAVPTRAEKAALTSSLRRHFGRRHEIWVEAHDHYDDQVLALACTLDEALDLVRLQEVLDLSYRFNTRYQRQGMALQRRWHNPLLAAQILTEEEQIDMPQRPRPGRRERGRLPTGRS